MMDELYVEDSRWNNVPDFILLHIFRFLRPYQLLNAGLVCKHWNCVSYDELLWKSLFYKLLKVKRTIPLAAGRYSWYQEYKRLIYSVPSVCTETHREHSHQVLHVSCSHDGTMFATSSKDGFIIVWNLSDPASIKYSHNMKKFCWKYTQFSQFNRSDTLLLVSGVHFGSSHSTSGEIAVFSLQGGFELQCRVSNKPYDIFGTWFSDRELLSGNLYWLNQLVSITALWISKASQEADSEHTPILNRFFRFYNVNASSVRRIMITEGPFDENPDCCIFSSDNRNGETGSTEISQSDSLEGNPGEEETDISDVEDEDLSEEPEKLLIFITGSKTYTPHQIGLKKVKGVKFPKRLYPGPSITERLAEARERQAQRCRNQEPAQEEYDSVDCFIEMNGHIIGIALSPDHRYLYVNCRPWPEGYRITNPLMPPPIATEIDIHVVDLKTFTRIGTLYRSHKAFTCDSECFFIFLDVSSEYVASGAEDKHGYIWDKHYGICLARYPHLDVVNCVAFSPTDPSLLITTSDDHVIKIWRSKQYLQEVKSAQYRDISHLSHAISLVPL